MLRRWMMFIGIGLLLWTQGIEATQVVWRFVLAVGANFGGSERTPLRYAVSDAEHFAQVLEMMGGVDAADQFLLREPSVGDFKQALTKLQTRVAEASQSLDRIEVVLYYSGHADENGLLLGHKRFAYQDLRQAMRDISADVQIAVLDACASGAITRFKGGSRQQPFLVDASSNMKGHAFLTSIFGPIQLLMRVKCAACKVLCVLMGGLRKDLSSGPVRPYVSADGGFVLIFGLHTGFGSYPTGADIIPAVRLGVGVDLRLGERWMLGATEGYYGMRSFSDPIGGIDNYSGPELSVGISRLIGG